MATTRHRHVTSRFSCRKRQLSCVSAYPNSCPCTRPSVSYKNLPHMKLTPTISLSTNCYFRNQVRLFYWSDFRGDLLTTRALQHPTANTATCVTRCSRNIWAKPMSFTTNSSTSSSSRCSPRKSVVLRNWKTSARCSFNHTFHHSRTWCILNGTLEWSESAWNVA